jgi:hypothetical protein
MGCGRYVCTCVTPPVPSTRPICPVCLDFTDDDGPCGECANCKAPLCLHGARGWDVFEGRGGRLEIEREDESPLFADDDEALAAAHAAAAQGNRYAVVALECIWDQDFARWDAYLKLKNACMCACGRPTSDGPQCGLEIAHRGGCR